MQTENIEDKNLIRVLNLKKYFPVKRSIFGKQIGYVHAVDDITFEVKAGETFGLVGESGCGKTTLGRTILRLIEPSDGKIFFKNHEITKIKGEELRRVRKHIQIIFQDPYSSLNPRLKVSSIVSEGLVAHKIGNKEERQARVKDVLEKVGLDSRCLNKYPNEFSGGQRQRICIARAIVLNPQFIVCDEPVSSLDVSIQAQIINLLMDLQEKLGLSYLFISHDLAVVEHISKNVGVMYLGEIVELASKEKIFKNPLHPYTQALLSAVPQIDPATKQKKIILSGDVPSPVNIPSGCRFHTRCPKVFERCKREMPQLKNVDNDHQVRCFIYSG